MKYRQKVRFPHQFLQFEDPEKWQSFFEIPNGKPFQNFPFRKGKSSQNIFKSLLGRQRDKTFLDKIDRSIFNLRHQYFMIQIEKKPLAVLIGQQRLDFLWIS